MGRLKIKDIEGETEELTKFFADSNCSLEEYLNPNKTPKINVAVLIVTMVVYVIFACVLFCLPKEHIIMTKVLTIICFMLAGLSVIFTHLYWRNTTATIIAGAVFFLLYLVAIEVISPAEAGLNVKDKIENISS
ncbi:MAG: hypothetical protein IKV31_01030 [Paludibacteraceae bacterium]|nr:hypothetical protein [Paludibacteraceae bacterium]